MKFAKLGFLMLLTTVASGCYHATVQTGVQPTPGSDTRWAHSWIYGLVPPSTVNATEECGGAPASSVETQVSFVNGIVGGLTMGIYTPMTIKVTCGVPVR